MEEIKQKTYDSSKTGDQWVQLIRIIDRLLVKSGSLGSLAGYTFLGFLVDSEIPTPKDKVCYLIMRPGTYQGFSVNAGEIALLLYTGSKWEISKTTQYRLLTRNEAKKLKGYEKDKCYFVIDDTILINARQVYLAAVGNRLVNTIYIGANVVWQGIRSCFGSGHWEDERPWDDSDGWKDQ